MESRQDIREPASFLFWIYQCSTRQALVVEVEGPSLFYFRFLPFAGGKLLPFHISYLPKCRQSRAYKGSLDTDDCERESPHLLHRSPRPALYLEATPLLLSLFKRRYFVLCVQRRCGCFTNSLSLIFLS